MRDKMIKIGVDLDDTINASSGSIAFFSLITNLLEGRAKIYIITNRDKREESRKKTIIELKEYNIYYDELVITGDKADFILTEGISVYIDDVDEYFQKLPESVTVLKIREPGNFDFDQHKWIYGNSTGINID